MNIFFSLSIDNPGQRCQRGRRHLRVDLADPLHASLPDGDVPENRGSRKTKSLAIELEPPFIFSLSLLIMLYCVVRRPLLSERRLHPVLVCRDGDRSVLHCGIRVVKHDGFLDNFDNLENFSEQNHKNSFFFSCFTLSLLLQNPHSGCIATNKPNGEYILWEAGACWWNSRAVCLCSA